METGKCNSTVGLEGEPEMVVEKQQWLLFNVMNKLNLKTPFKKSCYWIFTED